MRKFTPEERKEIRKEAKLWLDKYLTKHGIKKEELLENIAKKNPYNVNGITPTTGACIAAYIAGATKASKNCIVWHDLIKNPDDLPPIYDSSASLSKNVLLNIGIIGYYNYSQKKWCVSMGNRIIKDVTAWCEVPQYTEEFEKHSTQLSKCGTIEVDPIMETFLRGR